MISAPSNLRSFASLEPTIRNENRSSRTSESHFQESSEGDLPENMKKVSTSKEKWVLGWNLMMNVITFSNDILYILFFS